MFQFRVCDVYAHLVGHHHHSEHTNAFGGRFGQGVTSRNGNDFERGCDTRSHGANTTHPERTCGGCGCARSRRRQRWCHR